MIIGSVPLYNIMAVVVLSFFSPERRTLDAGTVKKTLKGIVTNPIIIGILVGMGLVFAETAPAPDRTENGQQYRGYGNATGIDGHGSFL